MKVGMRIDASTKQLQLTGQDRYCSQRTLALTGLRTKEPHPGSILPCQYPPPPYLCVAIGRSKDWPINLFIVISSYYNQTKFHFIAV